MPNSCRGLSCLALRRRRWLVGGGRTLTWSTHDRLRLARWHQDRKSLHDLVRDEIAPGTGVTPDTVWTLLDSIVRTLGPRNRALLEKRDALQAKIDAWLGERRGTALEPQATAAFLREIGYLVPVGPAFKVTTTNVDPEIATLAGPQLVVPVDNPRYALNAANARWGSLYDALYGTNVIAEDNGAEKGRGYNPVRGERVIAKANEFLDQAVPLTGAQWADVDRRSMRRAGRLACRLRDGRSASLVDAAQFVGLRRAGDALTNVLLRHHGLHIDIVIDPTHPIGRQHPAGVKDVVLESALTTIMDCEDSVAAVDAADKTVVYRNWCGIMRGTLAASVAKGSGTIERRLNADREYTAPNGAAVTLPGRSLLLVRHVGSHVLTDAVTDSAGQPIAETFLDCVLTTLAALHDLKGLSSVRNSRSRQPVHRQAETARPRGSGAVGRAVRDRRARVRPAGQHAQDRHHGRGAPHDGQPQRMHSRRARTHHLHQHRLPRSHRRRAAHAHGSGPRDSEARDQRRALDRGVRGLERARRPRDRAARARPDRQRHVGDARRDARDARHQARPSEGRRDDGLGALADRRDFARDSLPPNRRRRAAARDRASKAARRRSCSTASSRRRC